MDTPIIDADTHFTELPDLWTSRLPRAWGDDVMHVRWDERAQRDLWVSGDHILGPAWGYLAYGLERANSEDERPARRGDVHIATWDQSERVKIMDQVGIQAAVLYPNVAGLNPTKLLGMSSRELATAHVIAYNDGQLEWARNYPGRFIPMLVVPFWDIKAAVAEIERHSNNGFGGIVMTGAPYAHGCAFLADPGWDPMWSACVSAGLSVSFHVANGAVPAILAEDHVRLMAPATNLPYTSVPLMLANGTQVADLLLSGILLRFPTLKFVSVESGLGWVPFVLETVDYFFKRAHGRVAHPWGDLLPSELFKRNIYVNYWYEKLEPWHVEIVGENNILFETDFPHRACLEAGELAGTIERGLAGVSVEVKEKILWRNSAQLYKDALTRLNVSSVG